jgi:hypothetical protein
MIYTTNAVEALRRKYEAEIDVALIDEERSVRRWPPAEASVRWRSVGVLWRGVVRRPVTKA